MFGILASMMHNATRTESHTLTEMDRARRLSEQREEEKRRHRDSLEELNRFRRGYW